MKKHIIIIGGGISGLSLLHYLRQKYSHDGDVRIFLLEKNDHLGGTIRSLVQGGCLFETGPNGFLDSKKRTLEFVREIGLEGSLIRANEESKTRYLSVNNMLHPLPTDPKSFLSFNLLNPLEKFRVLGEFFIPRGGNPDESVYDFGKRRFGEKFSKIFLDPMVSGVYAGDARKAHLKTVFPRILAMEQEHGSLFKAMIKIRNERKSQGNGGSSKGNGMGAPVGALTSFHGGVGKIIDTLGNLYQEHIRLDHKITTVSRQGDQYMIRSMDGQKYSADELFMCTPAYSTGLMLRNMNNKLSQALEKVYYAPVAVLGLVYSRKLFENMPKGFGYLIPSSEQKEILGVLFESNIFPGRCREDQVMFRVMIGGARHPDILKKTKEDLVGMVEKDLNIISGNTLTKNELQEFFYVPWQKAIPQYDCDYLDALMVIEDQLEQNPKLHLVANYLKGVSLNDCIENAYQAAQTSSIDQ